MKKYLTSMLLWLTIPIGEIHTFWERSKADYQNWIVFRYVPMTLQQNFKFVFEELNFVLYFVAFFLYGKTPNKINKTTVKTFIWFCVIDMGMYFANWKTWGYGYVYVILPFIWVVMYYWNYLWRKNIQ